MRGGAIPILAWGTILAVLAAGNWVWDDKLVNGLAATAAVLIVYGFGAALRLARRDALRRGPPKPQAGPQTVPQTSVAAMLMGLSAGCALFGLAWARFLLDFGIAMFVISLGRIVIEVRAERTSRRQSLGQGERR